ncbi:MAG: type II secretion system F family protein [Thermoleophilaceae bacterium]
MTPAAAPAFAAGACATGLLLELGRAGAARAPVAARALAALVDALARLGREGREPGGPERRQLLLAGAGSAFAVGTLLAGPLAGAALAGGGTWLAARALVWRRTRYRRAVESGVPAAANAIADALGGGHSLRGALAEAAASLPGAAGHELRRVRAELQAGAGSDGALEAMRARARSSRIDTLVAACLLQRRAGGDLAKLLRECAEAFEDQSRVDEEARAATAQARFTGLLVVLLPAGGALLAELASPGFLLDLWGSLLTAWLVGLSIGLQLLAAVLIRRLGRVRW